MRLTVLAGFSAWLCACAVPTGDRLSPACLMQPAAQTIALPDSGFVRVPGEDFSGDCDSVPAQGWSRGTSGPVDLLAYADGPAGSGRYWTVTAAVAERQSPEPGRGVCMSTSTVGWRTLQRYSKGALAWLDDVDDNGIFEFVLWDSFALRDDASMAEHALMAWIYRLDSSNSLVLDRDLSRRMARAIGQDYRAPLRTATGYSEELRTRAADALESFADRRCSLRRRTPGL